ncbi:MAG: hypothetical protein HY913_24410 [Desulfomonile tiedjei]|nr:hypothetical protein [Desulfomonile tiedjei]
MNTRASVIITSFCLLLTSAWFVAPTRRVAAQDQANQVCKPMLDRVGPIELGKAGLFSWTCPPEEGSGKGYYVVFIRPSGTYVLLKVPQGRTSFEFTPDTAGPWRWLVINTDPDRTKPDVESDPGRFDTIPSKEPSE